MKVSKAQQGLRKLTLAGQLSGGWERQRERRVPIPATPGTNPRCRPRGRA